MSNEYVSLVRKVRRELDSHHEHCGARVTLVHEAIDALSDWYYKEVIPNLQRLERLQNINEDDDHLFESSIGCFSADVPRSEVANCIRTMANL